MATGKLYASTVPSSIHFEPHATGGTATINSIIASSPDVKVKVYTDGSFQNTHHKLVFNLTVSVGGGSAVTSVTMEGNSSNVTDSTLGSYILKGAVSGTTSVVVPLPTTPPSQVTVTGVYVECTDANQDYVEEV